MKRENIAKLSAVIITLILVAILLSQISIGDVAKTLTRIEPIYLIIGFVLCIFTYFLRALRFHVLLNNKISINSLFKIVCVHNMINRVLPARTGEVSYVYLIKRRHDIPTGEGIASLMVARMFDFITISLFFFVAAVNIKDLPEIIGKIIWIIAGFMVLLVLLIVWFVYFGNNFIGAIKRIVSILNIEHFNAIQYLLRKGEETAQSFETIKSKRVVVWTIAISIGIWLAMYLFFYLLIYAFGMDLTLFEIIIIASFGVLLPLLPFYGMGGFGTTEATFAVLMISFGVMKELAICTSFGLHIISLVYTLVLGGCGAWALNFKIKIFRRA